jgi:solute carrier family 45, member 1/2/4
MSFSSSSFVPILSHVKNKNVDFFLDLISKINLSNPTQRDYDNLNRKKTRLELVLISLVVFGIEICYAAETAFISPILQQIGVPLQFMSMVWCLSPILGFFTCPILGSLSDSCRSRLGRRRPFIIVYSIGILFGLLLTGYGHILGTAFNPTSDRTNWLTIFLTIVGVVLLDFDCDACQSPARAYLIDVSLTNDHSIGLSTFTIMAGAGGALGYILGGIPWSDLRSISFFKNTTITRENDSFGINNLEPYQPILASEHKQILFTFVAIIYIICAIISLTSFKEIPLDTCSPCKSADEEKNTKAYKNKIDYIKRKIRGSIDLKYERMSEFSSEDSQKDPDDDISSIASQILEPNEESTSTWKTLKYYLNSIYEMPSSLRLLCLTHCFCWMSLLCYSLYFTDFVGEEIFGKFNFYFLFLLLIIIS